MSIKCTCCQSDISKKVIYSIDNCPVVNNVVYRTKEEALNCTVGGIELVRCSRCNFVFNCNYDEKLLSYNSDYDNRRSFSPVYNAYMEQLVDLVSTDLDKKNKILEIGCGNGEFLKKVCSSSGAQGFGYDPAYEGREVCSENVNIFKRYFDATLSNETFDVVILRHVLEHIPQPYTFLKTICDNNILQPGAKLWIEVPDFEWTLNKAAFYDITYEHCNYFFKQTLIDLLTALGFNTISLKNIFDGQYILLEATSGSGDISKKKMFDRIPLSSDLTSNFDKIKTDYDNLIKNNKDICVWGASGKGVIFLSRLSGAMLKKIRYVIDVNPQKQGRFLPLSGNKVDSHEVLRDATGRFLVLVMNGIYKKEIKNMLDNMMVEAHLYTS